MSRGRPTTAGAGLDAVIDRLLRAAEEGSGASAVVERSEPDPDVVDAIVTAGAGRGFDVRTAVGTSAGGAALEVLGALLTDVGDLDRRPNVDLPALEAIASHFDAAAVRAPVLLVVDHADAVDAQSARALAYLVTHLDARRLSVCLVTAVVPAGSWLDDLVIVQGVPRHRLEAGSEGPGPDALDALLGRLDDGARRVVEALAVLGPSPSVGTLAAVADVAAADALEMLDRLFQEGLLRRLPSGVGHLVLDTVVLDQLPPGRRSELHGRAASHARAVGEPVEVVAAHLERAVPGTWDWAPATLRAAASRAMHAGEPGRAAAWLQRAMEEVAATGDDVPLPLLLELVAAQLHAGAPGAFDSLRLAIERTEGSTQRDLQIKLARNLAMAGRLDEAVELLDALACELDAASGQDGTRLEVLTALAATCRLSLHLRARSEALLDELRSDPAAAAVDDPAVLAELAYEHSLAGTGREVVIELGDRAMSALGRRSPSPVGSHGLFLALVFAEDHEGAQLLCDRLHGDPRQRPLEAHRMGTLALAQGDLDRAVAWSRMAVADIEWVAPMLVPGARAQLARALVRQGDLDGADEVLDLPGGDARWRRHATYHPVLLAHAELAAARGEWRRAASFADASSEFARAMGTFNPAVIPWPLVSGRARAALGRVDEAVEVLDGAISRATAFGAPGILHELIECRRSIGAVEREATGAAPPAAVVATAPSAPAQPTLRLLGDTVLVLDGETHRLRDDLVDRAVCVVAVSAHGLHDEQLAEGLWPEGDPAVGRTRLRNVLMRIRQRYGPVLERRGRTIELAPHVTVDVRRFEDLAVEATGTADADAAERAGKEALALYQGDLCPAHPFEAWAVAPRAAARQRWLALLDRVADLAAARGDLATATQLFEQAVAAEPWDEDRYLDAAERLLDAGRPAAARGVLRRSEVVCAELGVPPSPRHEQLRSALGG